mmetsp:Transcript_37027/g.110889  ORF Transcript_37027/g.110889 Transcript_37027/m.110889 type:complete len:165 (-) Transcript_37027:794-1288(-)
MKLLSVVPKRLGGLPSVGILSAEVVQPAQACDKKAVLEHLSGERASKDDPPVDNHAEGKLDFDAHLQLKEVAGVLVSALDVEKRCHHVRRLDVRIFPKEGEARKNHGQITLLVIFDLIGQPVHQPGEAVSRFPIALEKDPGELALVVTDGLEVEDELTLPFTVE